MRWIYLCGMVIYRSINFSIDLIKKFIVALRVEGYAIVVGAFITGFFVLIASQNNNIPIPTPTNISLTPFIPTDTPDVTLTSTPSWTLTFTLTSTDTQTDTPTYTSTLMPTLTASATVTSTPTTQPSATPSPIIPTQLPTTGIPATPTVLPSTLSYPCPAQIIFRSSATLNVIRANPANNAPLRSPIQQGSSITILARVEERIGEVWYQIADTSGKILGWIFLDYVIPSMSCP